MSKGPAASEAEVVSGCKRGAEWAQRALFERHHRAIFRFLVARCGDPSLAEDLVQETFLRAYEAMPGFRGDARVDSWMMRIALNCLYAVGRRGETARRKLVEVETGEPRADWARAAGSVPAVEHGKRDLLRRALRRLEDDEAAVVLLHDLQGYRYREIAVTMGIAVGTVGSRLNRARARLREIIDELSRRPEESTAPAHPTQDGEAATDDKPPGISQHVRWSEQ